MHPKVCGEHFSVWQLIRFGADTSFFQRLIGWVMDGAEGGFWLPPCLENDPFDCGGKEDAVSEAAELNFRAASLATDLDVEKVQDAVEERAFGIGVRDVFVGDEGVFTGEETFFVNDDVIEDLVGAQAQIEDAEGDECEE